MQHPEPTCPLDAEASALAALASPDDTTRARAVGALCPCRVGHEVFERHLSAVAALTHDPSPAVRKAALHVFEDAFEMQSAAYPTNPRENTNDMLRCKRASRFHADPDADRPRDADHRKRRR